MGLTNAENLILIKYLLSIIAVFGGSNIAILIVIARKYIKIIDNIQSRFNTLEAEHCMLQKDKTSINGK